MSANLDATSGGGRAGARLVLLDALRSVSIVRVVLVHLFVRFDHPAFLWFTFLGPGMPIVFAVSGALSYAALARGEPGTAARFWRSRARRLLFPFWAYAACAVALLLVLAARTAHPWHAIDGTLLWRWAVPLAQPEASPALKTLALHLWFVPPFVYLLALAPALVAFHRRAPHAGTIAFLALAVVLEAAGVEWVDPWRNTLHYGIAFQAGFALTDGSAERIPRAALLAAAPILLAAGLAWHHHVAPGLQLYAAPLAHVIVGLGYLPLWVAARGPVERAFRGPILAPASRAVNRRAYTLFLWGPAATEAAWRLARIAPEPLFVPAYFAGTLALLVATAWIAGRVEDRAARRAPSGRETGGP